MSIKSIFHIFLILSLTIFVSCNEAEESVEVVDQGRFDSEPTPVEPAPTAGDIDLTTSIVFIHDSTLLINQVSEVKLVLHDSDGNELALAGQTVTFSLTGSGTSDATIGGVVDEGEGVYTASVTGLTPGTSNSILATVNGNPVTSVEFMQVGGGPYFRDITLDIPTDQDEYQIKLELDSTNFDYSHSTATGDDLLFFDDNANSLSYYIEKWDTSGTSIVWVKVQDTGTSSVTMYYGDTTLAASSSQENTFSYAAAKSNWVELSYSMGNSTMSVASYIAGNSITLGHSSGTVNITASPNTPTTQTNVSRGLISAFGPISARYERNNRGGDSISSLAFATTVMGYSMSRNNDDWDFYNPQGTDANISIENYDASGNLLGTNNYVVPANDHLHVDMDVSKMGLVTSDQPIVGLYYGGTSDGALMMPLSTDIIVPLATSATIGITEDSTVGKIYKTDGTIQNFSGNKGETIAVTGGGSQHLSEGARVIANRPIMAYGQADSDGSDSESFWPVDELDRDYIIPNNTQYFTIFCAEEVNLTIYNPDGSVNETTDCLPAFENPGLVTRGAASGNNNYSAGTRITGDANFYIFYEYSDQDETNVLSWKQGRAYSFPAPVPTVGAEQTWD